MEKKEKLFFIFQIFLRIQTSYSQRLNKTSNEIVFGHARAIPYDTECPDLFNVPTPDGRTITAQGFLMQEEKDSINGQVLRHDRQ